MRPIGFGGWVDALSSVLVHLLPRVGREQLIDEKVVEFGGEGNLGRRRVYLLLQGLLSVYGERRLENII